MKQFFIFFAVFMIGITGLSAQEFVGNDQGNDQITAISISGLKKTKPHIIERPLDKFIGRNAADVDINEVIAIVKDSGIVEPLSVEIKDTIGDNQEGNGKTLVVTVQEKWSIFPIPLFSITSHGWNVGGAFMDANAFGLKDNVMVMGSYGTDGWMANVMFIDPPDGVGDYGWNIMGMFFYQDKENMDQTGEQILRRYNSISINPSIGLSYKLTESVTPSISVAYRNVALRDTESPVNAPENGVHAISLSQALGYSHDTWDGYFLNEISAALKYTATIVIGDKDAHSIAFNGTWNQTIVPSLRLTAKTGIIFATPSSSPFFESSPINAAVNILPQKYSAVDFSGISVGLEQFLFAVPFGSVSISAAYQAVYSNSELLRNQFDHGVVAMLQLYLSRVAIPGIGLGGAYNVAKNTWEYAFNIGMQF
jgi:hypothetical protein